MAAMIKLVEIKDFIRITEAGKLDIDSSRKLLEDIVATTAFHGDHNLLIDLRETTVSLEGMSDLLTLAMDAALYESSFLGNLGNKIANVIPDDEERISVAKAFKTCLIIKGFEYDFFTDFEAAIEWLSETSRLR